MTTRLWNFRIIGAALVVLLTTTFSGAQTAAETTAASAEATAAEDAASEEAADEESSGDSAEGADADAATEDEQSDDASEEEPMDGETYQVRLRDLEQRVDELKEQIRRSHTRLSLLSDTILSGASGGARAEIEFVNDLSGAWHVIEAVFVMDGAVQYKKSDDTGVLAKQKRIPIFSGSIPTGDHTLQVMLKLRGHGFGVFSYLRGMEASLTTDHSFTVTSGKVVELDVTAWEQGGPTTPVEEQPDIRFQQNIRSVTDTPRAAPAKSSSSGAVDVTTDSKSSGSGSDKKVGGGLSVGGSSSGD